MSRWNRRVSFAALAVASVLLASPSAARASEPIRVTIPFAFLVGRTQLPAGTYVVSTAPGEPSVATIESASGRRIVCRLTLPWQPDRTARHAKLVFDKIGGHYVLARIDPRDAPASRIPITRAALERALVADAAAR